jgi:hypothetical protein
VVPFPAEEDATSLQLLHCTLDREYGSITLHARAQDQDFRPVVTLPLRDVREGCGLEVLRALQAQVEGPLVILSCACVPVTQGEPSPPGPVPEPPSPPQDQYCLLVYHLPGGASEPRLCRAFVSPTGAPFLLEGVLPRSKPDVHAVYSLARDRMVLSQGAEDQDGDEAAVSTLLVWSRCTVYLLKALWDSGPSTAPAGPPWPQHHLWSALPPFASPRQPLHDSLVPFVEGYARAGQLDAAIAIAKALLMGEGHALTQRDPPLHHHYLRLLAASDPSLQRPLERARLAQLCIEWMLHRATEAGRGGASHEDLVQFLTACPDYDVKAALDFLLQHGRVAEALLTSHCRGLSKELCRTLSSHVCLPMGKREVEWLIEQGAAGALLQHEQPALWMALPLSLQLAVLLSDERLLRNEREYDWLLAHVASFPPPCLRLIVGRLAVWLRIGDAVAAEAVCR